MRNDIPLGERCIVALDYSPKEERKLYRVADILAPAGVTYKLHASALTLGPRKLKRLARRFPGKVFLDCKFHDIPKTMRLYAEHVAELEVAFVSAHASAGPGFAAFVETLARLAPEMRVIAIGVLTGQPEEDVRKKYGCLTSRNKARELLESAHAAYARYGTASADHLAFIRDMGNVMRESWYKDMTFVVPGVRPAWSVVAGDDQVRISTPAEAVTGGADYIVVGRPITESRLPYMAALRVLGEIRVALEPHKE